MYIAKAPLENRVLPDGRIVAISQRGSLMGNRGCLHDDTGQITRQWRSKAWISCVLEHGDHKVSLRAAGRYTPLFFKDEVSALAAGHRPCARCRPKAYRRFVQAVEHSLALEAGSLRARDLDRRLHCERLRCGPRLSGPSQIDVSGLPNGTLVAIAGRIHEVRSDGPHPWTWGEVSISANDDRDFVVTPPTAIAALEAGYLPLQACLL